MGAARPRVRAIAAGLLALVASLLVVSAAQAAPGDVYLADESGGPGAEGAIFKIAPAGGPPQLITDSATLDAPSGMTLDPVTGQLLVADYSNTIHTIDRTSGALGAYATGPAEAGFLDVVVAPGGQVYATDQDNSVVYRIDPTSKAVTPIASNFFLPSSSTLAGIAASRAGKLYVTDESGIVYEIDPSSGAARVFAHDPQIAGADGLAFSPDERFLYVAAFCRPVLDCDDDSFPPNQIAKIDMATGAVSTVVTTDDSVAVSLLPDGTLLNSDTDNGEDNFEGIQHVTGSALSAFSDSPDYNYPHDTVVEPDLCAGKIPTVVGTTGPDNLVGSPFADVVSTLGGKDTVKAGGGNDIVCGGAGKDKLFGQGGRDRLLGQAGKDVLNGGKKKDVLKGGKGRDNCRAGKGDKLRSC